MASARLLTTVDRAEAQAMCAMLQAHGIEAEVVGVLDSARVGVGAFALPVHVDVPAEDEGLALRLLAAERAEHLAAEEADREEVRASVRSPKRRIAALGLPVLLPGLAHVYVGRSVTGWLLAASALLFLLVLWGPLFPAYVVVGLLDALLAVRALGRNAGPPSTGWQVLTAAGIATLALVVALAPHVLRDRAQARHRAELQRYGLVCTSGSVTITHRGEEARTLVLHGAAVVVGHLLGERRVSARLERRELELAPSAEVVVGVGVAPGLGGEPADGSTLLASPAFGLGAPRRLELQVESRVPGAATGPRWVLECPLPEGG